MFRYFAHPNVIGVTFAQTIALLLPAIVLVQVDPMGFGVVLLVGVATAFVWETIFASLRKHPFSFHGLTTALIFVVMLPTTLPIWQMVFTLSLGVVLGEMIFGGRGYGFVSPAVVALCLTVFSFPEVQLSAPSQTVALAVLPGAMLLLLLGLISGRVILGTFIGVASVMLLTGADIDVIAIGTALSFGLIFLICDPTAAAATNPGRWLYGILSGGLVVLFAAGGSLTPESVVFAAMMASVFAPLIDHLVVLAHSRWRGIANG